MGRPGSIGMAAAILLGGLMAAGSASAAQDQARPSLRGLVPADQAAAGWARDDKPQEFIGEDLYTYIDGGAEIYQEYGFVQVIVQDYKNAKGKSLSLEIFEMASPEAAYGMYTFKRSGKGKSLSLGGGGELEDYYLNFWKGRFLVTMTGFDGEAATLAGLQAVAAAVDGKITDTGKVPELVGSLPSKGLAPGSVKYLKGLLGLNNVCPLYTASGLGFQAAVRGLYESGETLVILEYSSAEVRLAAWLELKAGLEKSGHYEQPSNYLADVAAVFKDAKGRFFAFREAGTRLFVGIHGTLDWALETVARVR
jgi:hypothetical protein